MKSFTYQIAIMILAALTVLPVLADDSKEAATAELEQGKILNRRYEFKFKEDPKKTVGYCLYIPTNYDKKKPTPLIVALHGLFSNPGQIMNYPKFIPHAEKRGYIIVAPMGYNSRGWYGSRKTGRSDPDLQMRSEQDVMNVLKLTREELNIDESKIYLLGHSMGGGGTLHLAIKYSEIWAAIAPIAPAVPKNIDDLKDAKHIPAIVIQGDKDGLVHGTRRWVNKMKELEMDHKYIEVAGGGHLLVAFQHFPEIFDFFDSKTKDDDKKDGRTKVGGKNGNNAKGDESKE
jgi:poly(3-hydroxybutyrate) depolymerase